MWKGPILSLTVLLTAGLAGGPSGVMAGPSGGPSAASAETAGADTDAARETPTLPAGFLALDAAGSDRYSLHLDGPAFLVVDVDQRGVDLRVSLEGPDGHPIAIADGPGGAWSRDSLAALTDTGGDFVLDVRRTAGESGGGRYRLLLQSLRPRLPGDEERLRIEQRIADAFQRRETSADGALEGAIATLEEAVQALRELGDLRREAVVLHELADALRHTDRVEDGLPYLQREREIRRRLGDPAGEVTALVGAATLLSDLERYDEATATAEEALALVPDGADPDLAASASNVLGFLAAGSRPAAAVPLLETAVDGHLQAGNLRDEVIALVNLGFALKYSGRQEAGCLAVLEAANTADAIRYSDAGLKISEGICHREAGRVGAAMSAFQEARRLAGADGNRAVQAYVLVHVGSLLAELGEYGRAQAAFEEALPDLPRVDFKISAEMHLGWLANAQGDAESGLRRFSELGDRYAGQLDALDRIMIQKGIGSALADLGRNEEALARFNEALGLNAASGNHFGEAETQRQIGRLLRKTGNLEGAREALARSLEAAHGNLPQQGATYQQMARLDAAAGRVGEGLDHIRKAIALREELRSGVVPPTLRASYLARWRDDFSLWIDLLLQAAAQGDAGARERAFAVSERAHARTLQELLIEAGGGEPQVPAPLAARQRALTAQLNGLIHQATVGKPAAAEKAHLLEQIRDVEAKLGELEWTILRPPPESGALEPRTLAEVQRLLADDDALLEYALGNDRSFLFVVRRDALDVFTLPAAEVLADEVTAVRSALRRPDRSLWKPLIDSSAQLYEQLVAPAEARLEGVHRLIVIPDRDLFYLPFETLLDDLPDRFTDPFELAPHYLVSRWDVGYAPSATVMGQLDSLAQRRRTEQRPEWTLVAFADSRGDAEDGHVAESRAGPDAGRGTGAPCPAPARRCRPSPTSCSPTGCASTRDGTPPASTSARPAPPAGCTSRSTATWSRSTRRCRASSSPTASCTPGRSTTSTSTPTWWSSPPARPASAGRCGARS